MKTPLTLLLCDECDNAFAIDMSLVSAQKCPICHNKSMFPIATAKDIILLKAGEKKQSLIRDTFNQIQIEAKIIGSLIERSNL